jgi:hypothetical protein
LARDAKKFKYSRLKQFPFKAQSTMEYAIIFPFLFFMIMGIWELAFMWHQYNSMEMALQDVASNLALLDGQGCTNSNEVIDVLKNKTRYLNVGDLDFNVTQNPSLVYFYTSNQTFKGVPYLTAMVDCSGVANEPVVPIVQLKSVHRLMFFSARLPDFRSGREAIVLIPDKVELVSSKFSSAQKY